MFYALVLELTFKLLHRGHSQMVSLLLKHHADPDCVDLEGNTPLHMACEEDRTYIAQLLVESNANMSLVNKVGLKILILIYRKSFDILSSENIKFSFDALAITGGQYCISMFLFIRRRKLLWN